MKICGVLQNHYHIVHVDHHSVHEGESISQECIRPEGHKGPHLIKQIDRIGGDYVVWENDLCPFGECEACDSDDPVENCFAYGEVSVEEARRLIEDPNYGE